MVAEKTINLVALMHSKFAMQTMEPNEQMETSVKLLAFRK
jgi:hypothetical protein